MKFAKLLVIALMAGLLLAACAPNIPVAGQTVTGTPAASTPAASTPAASTPAASTPANATPTTPGAIATPAPTGTTGSTQSPVAVTAARQLLSQQIGVPLDQIKIVKAEEVEWPNGCLGVQLPGKMCTQVVTPGYRVVFEAGGKQYEFHTDKTGGSILMAASPLAQTSGKDVVWEQTEGGVCSRAEIGQQKVAFGPCGGALQEVDLQPNRATELTYLLSTYKTFLNGTKAGTVQFNGQGQTQPTDAEMRSIAEWSRLVFMEAQGGRGGAAWGLAFAWHREGGIAGFCDDLGVYLNGWAMPSTCKAGQVKSFNEYHLTADELAQMYTWVDQYKSFDYEMKDAATTDAMKVTMTFVGTGSIDASPQEQQMIAGFAATVYANSHK